MEVDDAAIEAAIKPRLDWLVSYIALSHELDRQKQWHECLQDRAFKRTRQRLHLIMQMLAQCVLNDSVELYAGPTNGALGCGQINILDRAIFDEQCAILLTKQDKLFRYNAHMGSTPIFELFNELGYKPVRDGKALNHNRYIFRIKQNQLEERASRKMQKLQHAAGAAGN